MAALYRAEGEKQKAERKNQKGEKTSEGFLTHKAGSEWSRAKVGGLAMERLQIGGFLGRS